MKPDGEFLSWDTTDESSWVNAVSAFLDIGTLYVLNLEQIEPERLFLEDYYKSMYRESLVDFCHKWLPNSKADLDDSKGLMKAFQTLTSDTEIQKSLVIRNAHVMVSGVLDRLESMGLVNSIIIEDVEDIKEFLIPNESYNFKKYCLTKQGVDVALKINEHNDANKKHKQQLEINLQLKRNSTISATTAVAASVIASFALAFSFLNYEIAEKRLSFIEKSYFSKSVKNSELVDTPVKFNEAKVEDQAEIKKLTKKDL